MAGVDEQRSFTAGAALIEDALLTALAEVGGDSPVHASSAQTWTTRADLGHLAFAIEASVTKDGVALRVHLEPSLGRAVARALPFVGSVLFHRATMAALERGASEEIAEQDAAAVISQTFWEAFEGRLADLVRQAGGPYRGE